MLRKKKKIEASQNDDFFSDGDDGEVAEHEPMPDLLPVRKQAPRSRLLLLLLLLVAIGGGGYFYLLAPVEEPPPPPPQIAVRKPIPMPPAPVPATSEKPGEQAANAAPTTASVAQPAVPPAPATPAPAPAPTKEVPAKAATPGAPAAVARQAMPPAPASAAPVKEAAAPAEKAAEAKQAATPVTMAPAKAMPAPSAGKTAPAAGNYTIDAGAFLVKENRLAAEKAIVRLGYKPKITVVQRPVKMLRLRVGGPYPPMLAEARLAEVAQFAPTAFSVPNGDQVVVYAGSFFLVDEARIVADKLFTEGIRVEEETAQVVMPLEKVTFGSFASRNAAAEALAKAKTAGLQPAIVRK